MRASRVDDGRRVYFLLSELDPAEWEAGRELAYNEVDAGLAKVFADDAPGLNLASEGFVRYARSMVRQTAGLEPVPWEAALSAFMALVRGHDVNWWLAGSTALAARGLAVVPRDIDVITNGDGAQALQELLAEHLVEPLVRNENWIAEWWGRAFLGARVEWVGGVRSGVDLPSPADFGPIAEARLEAVTWRGKTLQVPPLDLQLAVARRRGLTRRVVVIQEALDMTV